MAVAVLPLSTVRLLDLSTPDGGTHVTAYTPGFTRSFNEEVVPFGTPFTKNAQLPPTATTSSMPPSLPSYAGSGSGGGATLGGALHARPTNAPRTRTSFLPRAIP